MKIVGGRKPAANNPSARRLRNKDGGRGLFVPRHRAYTSSGERFGGWLVSLSTNCSKRSSTAMPATCTLRWASLPCLRSPRPFGPARNQGAGCGRHHGPDEEHHARAMPAGVAGGRRQRLRLRLRRHGPLPRVGFQAEELRGHRLAVDSRQGDGLQGVGHAAGAGRVVRPAPRAGAGHRADGFRQDDHLGRDDRLHQPEFRPSHHHDRGSDRVLPLAQEVDGEPARSRASTCPVSPRPFAAPCGKTPT